MDPLSHAALGRSLVGAFTASRRPEPPLRGLVVAAVLGSLSPDIDAVFMPFGWDRYLRVHEVGTHTIVGTFVCALLTAALVHAFNRRTRYSSLVAAAWLGAASHVLLDLLSSARLRPAWPLLDTVVSIPLVAMADPWLLALLVGSAAGFAIWGRRVGLWLLGVTAVFLVAKGALGIAAFTNYREASGRSGEIVLARVVEAEWASMNSWLVRDRTASRLRVWRADAHGAQVVLSWPVEPESALVSRSRSLSTVQNFHRAHELGFAVTVPAGNARTLVLWSDIRFCWDPSAPGARAVEPVIRSATGNQQMACAVWFGGELDAAGAATIEMVKVGGLTQTRAPGR